VPEKDVLIVGSQQQVNVMSMEDDEFSSGDERVSSLLFYRLMFIS